MSEYKLTDYCCEGCGIYKMVKKRKTDGKMLCKKCSKNQSLGMFGKSEEKEDKKYTKKYSKRNSIQEKERKMKVELIKTNLKRYTFESPKIKKWVEDNSKGKVLNLFAGRTKLNLDEVRNDLDKEMNADYHKDALDFVLEWKGEKFDTIILDPPYSYRKSMEMYKGNRNSRFKLIADNIENVLKENGIIISFGYHSTFMGIKEILN